MKNGRRMLGIVVMGISLLSPMTGVSAAVLHPDIGFLVVAPDRGFLGNEEVRDVYDQFATRYASALVFATHKHTTDNLEEGIEALKAKQVKRIWVLPFFLSPSNALYQKALHAMQSRDWGLPIGMTETMKDSYLIEEILQGRIEELSNRPKKEALVVLGYGALDPEGEAAIKEDLEMIVERVNQAFHFQTTDVVVLYDGMADEDRQDHAFDHAIERIALNRAKAERVLVVPFNFGRKLTTMMATWTRVKRKLSPYDGIVADGEGILPHENAGIWLAKQANLRLPLTDEEIGVVVMPHGSDFNWNETIRRNLTPLLSRYKIEYAFSMADPAVIQRAVKRLEARGARAIMVIRVFSLASSFREKTEFILGLNPYYRNRGKTERVASPCVFVTLGGTEQHPLVAEALGERARALSQDPSKETVILLAHGTDDEEVNRHWRENLAALAASIRQNGGAAFRDIRYETWREDWPDKRDKAVAIIRHMIEEASRDGGIAIVVPERTTGQGPGEKYFKGLSYRYATGFAPHPNFLKWVEEQIHEGAQRLHAIVNQHGELQPHSIKQARLEE